MTPDEQKYVEELQSENMKLRAELEDSKASDAESLKLYRAARDRADAAMLQIGVKQVALIQASNMLNAAIPHGPADPDDPCPPGCKRCELEKQFPWKRNPDCECGRPAHEHGGCRNYRPKGA